MTLFTWTIYPIIQIESIANLPHGDSSLEHTYLNVFDKNKNYNRLLANGRNEEVLYDMLYVQLCEESNDFLLNFFDIYVKLVMYKYFRHVDMCIK